MNQFGSISSSIKILSFDIMLTTLGIPTEKERLIKYRYSIFVLCETRSITTTINANRDVLVSGVAIH